MSQDHLTFSERNISQFQFNVVFIIYNLYHKISTYSQNVVGYDRKISNLKVKGLDYYYYSSEIK